jgi:hypothetical protein
MGVTLCIQQRKFPEESSNPFFGGYMYVFGSKIASRKIERLADDSCRNISKLVNIMFSFKHLEII